MKPVEFPKIPQWSLGLPLSRYALQLSFHHFSVKIQKLHLGPNLKRNGIYSRIPLFYPEPYPGSFFTQILTFFGVLSPFPLLPCDGLISQTVPKLYRNQFSIWFLWVLKNLILIFLLWISLSFKSYASRGILFYRFSYLVPLNYLLDSFIVTKYAIFYEIMIYLFILIWDITWS